MSELEIEKVLVLSTGHITHEASQYLASLSPGSLVVNSFKYGWYVRVKPMGGALPAAHPSVLDCRDFAKEQKCDWIKFDQDGPYVDELPQYEW